MSTPLRRALAGCGAALLLLLGGCVTGGPNGAESARRGQPAAVSAERVSLKQLEVDRASDPAQIAPFAASSDAGLRRAAALALGRLMNPAGIPTLVSLSADGDRQVAQAALFALGQIDDPASAAALTAAVQRAAGGEAGAEALRSLGRVGGPDATEALAEALASPSAEARAAAATALGIQAYRKHQGGGLTAPQAQALVAALGDDAPAVRRGAAYALARATIPADQRVAATDALVLRLSDDDPHVRATSARAIGVQGYEEDSTRVAAALADPSWLVRVNALRAVAQLGGPTAAWVIRPALEDSHPLVQEQAVASLGKVGDPAAAEWIEPLLTSPSVGLSSAALGATASLMKKKAVPLLEEAARSSSTWTRIAAADALGDLKDPQGTTLLVARADAEQDPRVMVVIADALGRRDPSPEAEGALYRLLSRGDSSTVTVVAGIFGERRAVEAVLDLIDAYHRQRPGRDYEAQVAIIETFAAVNAPELLVRELLEGATLDPDGRVAAAAAATLNTLFGDEIELSPAVPTVPVSAATLADARRTGEVWIETSRGTIRVELFPEAAPITVANFARLARSGYYNGLLWHRVVPAFVAQTGSPRGDGWGGPGYTIPDELNPIPYEPGTVGMALSGPDTGGSQLFITHSYEPHLDGTYTVFGRVVEGMDVAESLVRNDSILTVRFAADAPETPDHRTLEAF